MFHQFIDTYKQVYSIQEQPQYIPQQPNFDYPFKKTNQFGLNNKNQINQEKDDEYILSIPKSNFNNQIQIKQPKPKINPQIQDKIVRVYFIIHVYESSKTYPEDISLFIDPLISSQQLIEKLFEEMSKLNKFQSRNLDQYRKYSYIGNTYLQVSNVKQILKGYPKYDSYRLDFHLLQTEYPIKNSRAYETSPTFQMLLNKPLKCLKQINNFQIIKPIDLAYINLDEIIEVTDDGLNIYDTSKIGEYRKPCQGSKLNKPFIIEFKTQNTNLSLDVGKYSSNNVKEQQYL